MVEVFTCINNYEKVIGHKKAESCLVKINVYLVSKGYFQGLKCLIDLKTPPLMCESSEPPTPLVACLFELLTRPLQLVDVVTSVEFRSV